MRGVTPISRFIRGPNWAAGFGRLRQPRHESGLVVIELKKPGVPTRGVRREYDNLQTSADRHPGVVRVQRAAHRLERHGQRRRLAHGGLGAVQAFEHASALLDQDAARFRPHLSGFCQEKNAFWEFLYCVSP